MIPKFTLLAHVLLISATLVAPSTGLQAGTGSPEKPQLQSTKRSAQNNWAGAVQNEINSIPLSAVTGTFIVPFVKGSGSNTGASVWVGIDGHTCGKALSAGVDATVDRGYYAWYQWYGSPYSFPDIVTISPGDEIIASVTVLSPTSGEVTIENLSNGMYTSTLVSSSSGERVCGRNAEWIVAFDAVTVGDPGLADFGTVNFTNAVATDFDGQHHYANEGAAIVNIWEGNNQITTVSTDQWDVSITYVGV